MKFSYKQIFYSLAIALVFESCSKDFLDVNEDPNSVTENTITPELIFPRAATAMGTRAASRNFEFLNKWLGYWSTSGSFAIDQVETSYNINFTFGENIWQNHYDVLFDLYKTKTKAIAKGDTVLAGASMVLSAKLWQELVDLYGNIPYSKAFENSKTRLPAYDNAKDIYTSLLGNLDLAKSYLQHSVRSGFEGIDLINDGDIDRWIKFANTLKLRLLIRQSEMAGFNPTAEIAKMKDGNGNLQIIRIGEDIRVNPGYVNDNNKQAPFYANYGLTPAGAEASSSTKANAYFVDLLGSTNDPREFRYFRAPAAGGAITGTVYGLVAGNPLGNASSGIGPGLAKSSSQDQWIYPAFESLFLEAEAIARGWVSGDAQAVYEAAVAESFHFLQVNNAGSVAALYLANQPIAMWSNAGATVLAKAKFIAYQKYIALAGIDPQEAYADLRRLNMIPNNGYLSVNPARISAALPVRLPYPQSEYTYNGTNANAQGTINVFTGKLFWQP